MLKQTLIAALCLAPIVARADPAVTDPSLLQIMIQQQGVAVLQQQAIADVQKTQVDILKTLLRIEAALHTDHVNPADFRVDGPGFPRGCVVMNADNNHATVSCPVPVSHTDIPASK